MIILGLILLALGFFRKKQTSLRAGPDFWTDWLLVIGANFLAFGLIIRLLQFTSTNS
jgi:hypothetical protein